MSYSNYVYDEQQVLDFFDILPELGKTENYLISTSARPKYLTEEEKLIYKTGRSEMLDFKPIRSKDKILRTLYKFQSNSYFTVGENPIPIPDKAITIYVNIHPTNVILAYAEFQRVMNEYLIELANNATQGRNIDDVCGRLKKFDRLLWTANQRAWSSKKFIDIDCDVGHSGIALETVNQMCQEFLDLDIQSYIIETYSGYHVMIEKKNIKFNYKEKVTFFDKAIKLKLPDHQKTLEIIVNDNSMVPLPGTKAGNDYKVKFWRYET